MQTQKFCFNCNTVRTFAVKQPDRTTCNPDTKELHVCTECGFTEYVMGHHDPRLSPKRGRNRKRIPEPENIGDLMKQVSDKLGLKTR